MVNAHKKALERMWKDRCTIWQRVEATDPDTNLTDFREEAVLKDQPCKLSFEKLPAAGTGHAAAVGQGVTLFLSSEVEVPAGCKITVRRAGPPEREFVFAQSGAAAVFTHHQDIPLALWQRWA